MTLFMRTVYCAVVLCLVAIGSVRGQTKYDKHAATRALTIGAGFAPGMSFVIYPEETPELVFAYRGDLDVTYPLSSKISAALALGFDSRGYNNQRINYFSIMPGFTFSSLFLGVNFGLPMSGSYTYADRTIELDDDALDRLNLIIEPRLGAVVPIVDDRTGWLGLTVSAGATVNEILEHSDVALPGREAPDYHMLSLHLGLTYQFAIPGTQRN